MRISVIGTRGFPGIQGGVEKHCESLYPLIGRKGNLVTVYRRKPYIFTENKNSKYFGICFSDLWTLKSKNFETIIHSFMAALKCLYLRPDVVHIHNIGPALVLPLLKLGGLKVVVTYHSPNYKHSKWGKIAKKVLLFGERLVGRLADKTIFVSQTQADLFLGKRKICIPNGVDFQSPAVSETYIDRIGIEKDRYILAVARFTPEKGLDVLLKAFLSMKTEYKLVIAGDADHETPYSKKIRKLAAESDRIVLTGYISGKSLNQVFSHARIFVLPSYHEGLPIALLEAMSYGLSVLVSDIPANIEVGLSEDRYFTCGDVDDLQKKLNILIEKPITHAEKQAMQTNVAEKYNWDKIADQTVDVYRNILNQRK